MADDKIVVDTADGEYTLTKKEEEVVERMLDTFEGQSPAVRVASFEALLANYCHECGEEQPDDPEDECPCVEASSEDEDEEDEDEEDEDEEDEEDEDEEDEDEEPKS
jgi:stringent starvation protein B